MAHSAWRLRILSRLVLSPSIHHSFFFAPKKFLPLSTSPLLLASDSSPSPIGSGQKASTVTQEQDLDQWIRNHFSLVLNWNCKNKFRASILRVPRRFTKCLPIIWAGLGKAQGLKPRASGSVRCWSY